MKENYEIKGVFPRQLAPGLWVLGNYFFNLYLVRGYQASALIEVGVSGVVDEIIRQLELLNVRPTFLVVTHPHADHVTGLAGLKEKFPQALVVAGEGAAEFLAHPKAAPAVVQEDRHMSEFLAAHGIQPGRPAVEEPPSLRDCMVAQEGDEMDLGGITLRYLVVKGHAPAKINVYIPEIKALILSDSLGFRFPGRGVFPMFLVNYSDYLATLERLEKLNPAILGVAHQGPVMGHEVQEAFREAREKAVELRSKIINDSRNPEKVIQDVFEEFYKDEMTIYTRENIMNCAKLVVRRAKA
jgi:2-aminobenzoylacetyl-CoA thioesterase